MYQSYMNVDMDEAKINEELKKSFDIELDADDFESIYNMFSIEDFKEAVAFGYAESAEIPSEVIDHIYEKIFISRIEGGIDEIKDFILDTIEGNANISVDSY